MQRPFNTLRKVLAIFFLLYQLDAKTQVILPTTESAFEIQHNFNPKVIKSKGIKKITFEIIDKKDFEVAVNKSLVETYEFNAEGLITRFYFTSIVKTIEKHVAIYDRKGQMNYKIDNEYVYDTISTSYYYSGKNLILKRFHDGNSYYESRYYRYDKEGNLTRELRYKETNNSNNKHVFILGNQVLLSEDSFQYIKYGNNQIKCICLNNENRSYKEKTINLDSLGRKKNVSEMYTAASWLVQRQRFEYSPDGITKAEFDGNADNLVVLRNVYEYDTNHELYAEKQYKNDVLLREINYINDKQNQLLNSFIIRDPALKSLRIVKLKYDFGSLEKTEQ